MQHYTTLQVWQRSHAFVLAVYKLRLPSEERYGLTAQLRRAAASVPTNLAEGAQRASQREFAHFINVSQGSLNETEYLLLLIRDLGYIVSADADAMVTQAREIARMLNGLRKAVLANAGPRSSATG